MGALIGLLAGVGLLLIWRSGPRAPQRTGRAAWSGRRQELLIQAGVSSISPAQLLGLQLLTAALVGVLVEVPVMLSVVTIVMRSRGWYERGAAVRRNAGSR